MRKISATYIFPGNRPPLKHGILTCDDDGTILRLTDTGGNLREESGLEHYSGILVPGFVNSHCHLELSHLKGRIPEKTGLARFLGCINDLRYADPSPNAMMQAQTADRYMQDEGIVAVGDISNTAATLEIKRRSPLFYHTFVEVFGFHPSRAERAIMKAVQVENLFREAGLSVSVTPHAPYSVSEDLFHKVDERAKKTNSILSVHNQESREENLFSKEGSGPLLRHIHDRLGIDTSHWKPTGKSSLSAILPLLNPKSPLLLVHNTYTSEEDIREVRMQRKHAPVFFVLCPRANLFIENHLPRIDLFRKEKLNICLGTDSLASNYSLSMLQEMITIQKHYPDIPLQELIDWASVNGARAINADTRFGCFETGKKPGVNLITGVDLIRLKLTGKSKVRPLRFSHSS